jgi:hypothetical protein
MSDDKRMNISDEAVEAAAYALYSASPWPTEWHDADMARKETYLHYATTALEAAAPHMIADCWDEAVDAGDNMGPLSLYRSPVYPLGRIEDKR